MPYTIEEEKTLQASSADLQKAMLGAVKGLEGEVLKHDTEAGRIEVKFPKTILGNVLGDRTQMELNLESTSATETKVALKIYPINPVGQVLQFGARKGVPRKVMTWFFAHIEHRLKSE
ncbi:MAG: hypothetical protein HON91_12535 [Anaerolineae bacterium]|nr:hypothetical protein [Anaerolineae bacterium]